MHGGARNGTGGRQGDRAAWGAFRAVICGILRTIYAPGCFLLCISCVHCTLQSLAAPLKWRLRIQTPRLCAPKHWSTLLRVFVLINALPSCPPRLPTPTRSPTPARSSTPARPPPAPPPCYAHRANRARVDNPFVRAHARVHIPQPLRITASSCTTAPAATHDSPHCNAHYVVRRGRTSAARQPRRRIACTFERRGDSRARLCPTAWR